MAVKQPTVLPSVGEKTLAHSGLGRRLRRRPPRRGTCAAEPPGGSPNGSRDANNPDSTELRSWGESGVPRYLQSPGGYGFCAVWQSGFPDSEVYERVWQTIRQEAQQDASSEPLLSSFLYASILAHKSFEQALAFVLANRLANPTMLPTQLFEIFLEVLKCSPTVLKSSVADAEAVRNRVNRYDECGVEVFTIIVHNADGGTVHRIANALWEQGQKVLALTLQSRVSEAFSVDIHPAAQIAPGVLLDHGTGVVIGETAVIGSNCSILQNVTLGGTGKEVGDRHPKIGANVLIGASATILGNIAVGDGSQVASGSLVLKPVPPHTMVAGSPAKVIGKVLGNPALRMEHWSRIPGSIEYLWQETLETAANGTPIKSGPDSKENMKTNQRSGAELQEVRIPGIVSVDVLEQKSASNEGQHEGETKSAEKVSAASSAESGETSPDAHQKHSDPEYFI